MENGRESRRIERNLREENIRRERDGEKLRERDSR